MKSPREKMYIIIYKCKEAIAENGAVITQENAECYVVDEEWARTSYGYKEGQKLDKNTKTFKDELTAIEVAKNFVGHPWYHRSNGIFRVVEVTPIYETLTGYTLRKLYA